VKELFFLCIGYFWIFCVLVIRSCVIWPICSLTNWLWRNKASRISIMTSFGNVIKLRHLKYVIKMTSQKFSITPPSMAPLKFWSFCRRFWLCYNSFCFSKTSSKVDLTALPKNFLVIKFIFVCLILDNGKIFNPEIFVTC